MQAEPIQKLTPAKINDLFNNALKKVDELLTKDQNTKIEDANVLRNKLNCFAQSRVCGMQLSPLSAKIYSAVREDYKVMANSYTPGGKTTVVVTNPLLPAFFLQKLTMLINIHNDLVTGNAEELHNLTPEELKELKEALIPSNSHIIKKIGNNKK